MITISLCMIVKNEEDVLERCLASVADLVDEIIIVDTGSTDQTIQIASKFTKQIFHYTWCNDFAAARNESFAHATKDYVLWLDADDILLEEDRNKLRVLKKTLDTRYDAVTFVYNYYSDADGNPLLLFKRERMVKRQKNYQWNGFVHEYIEINGSVYDSDITVTHARIHQANDRNLNIYKEKKADGIAFTPRDQYYYSNELFYHQLWTQAVPEYENLLTLDTWIEDKIDACCKLSECYQYLNQPIKERQTLLHTMEYTTPRAEAVYRLANSFERQNRFLEAIYWYEVIIAHPDIPENAGFVRPEYWTWRPHLQLCVCYYKIGDHNKSLEHHKIAYQMNPKEPLIQSNQKFFMDCHMIV